MKVLGIWAEQVILTNLSLEEKRQLGGFLQKDYTENRTDNSICGKVGKMFE